jgi:hypothetical protein
MASALALASAPRVSAAASAAAALPWSIAKFGAPCADAVEMPAAMNNRTTGMIRM